MNDYKNIIIGAGAAGLFLSALLNNRNTLVLEKNPYPGKKLNITGKGRCNITNNCYKEDIFLEIFTNEKFVYSAISDFDNKMTVDFFNDRNLKTKVERGGRIFPISDRARDVTDCLYKNNECIFKFNKCVKKIEKFGEKFIILTDKEKYTCENLVVATGGLSYPTTGSTGDGYEFLKSFGHTIIEPKPALVGVETDSKFKEKLMGISLKNIEFKLIRKKKVIKSEFGEALFTHYGLSGPTILRLSPFVKKGDVLSLDLKPALGDEKLQNRIQRDLDEASTKMIKNSLNHLLLSNMVEPILELSNIDMGKNSNIITKEERQRLSNVIKNMEFNVTARRPINEAIITDGGVKASEINPKTMESKLVDNLFVIGELLDVAANTGGYNLQIAFSTAYKAYLYLEG